MSADQQIVMMRVPEDAFPVTCKYEHLLPNPEPISIDPYGDSGVLAMQYLEKIRSMINGGIINER